MNSNYIQQTGCLPTSLDKWSSVVLFYKTMKYILEETISNVVKSV